MTAKTIGRAVVLALVFAGALLHPPAAPAESRRIVGKVVSVADGDTLTVAPEGAGRVKVRLYGIDAPEVRHKETPGQPFGQNARRALRALTLGRNVAVAIVDIDAHDRAVGVVYESGVDINLAMVREGWAWAYRRYLSAPYASEYLDAEREARAKHCGLWQQPNPSPPWEYRRRAR